VEAILEALEATFEARFNWGDTVFATLSALDAISPLAREDKAPLAFIADDNIFILIYNIILLFDIVFPHNTKIEPVKHWKPKQHKHFMLLFH
jgi:hypothetical protein